MSHQSLGISGQTQIIGTIDDMTNLRNQLVRNRTRIYLIPTMGALHNGHAALISKALTTRDKSHSCAESLIQDSVIIVSIFVNPVQFNSQQDLVNYPKSIEKDLEICQALGVDYVFLPRSSDIYPSGHNPDFITTVHGNVFIQSQLEGKSRPGHFTGMLTIVNKLFNITRPNRAFFGEKDYQQLLLVRRMVKDLNIDVIIDEVETVRHIDFLPLSSRNIRIEHCDRPVASFMSRILFRLKEKLEQNKEDGLSDIRLLNDNTIDLMSLASICVKENENVKMDKLLNAIDYLELRCSDDLGFIGFKPETGVFFRKGNDRDGTTGDLEGPVGTINCRLLISIILGQVRLLDNVQVDLNSGNIGLSV